VELVRGSTQASPKNGLFCTPKRNEEISPSCGIKFIIFRPSKSSRNGGQICSKRPFGKYVEGFSICKIRASLTENILREKDLNGREYG